MLPGLTLPASWRVLLETFRPAFRRSATFALFELLATGLVARAARRTVVGMLAGAGMAAVVSFHACCRFFSAHAWDADRLGLALAQPTLPVVVITGDGEMLMGMGSLATVALQQPKNLSIIVLDNEAYGETGGQASHTGGTADLVGVAKACGIGDSRSISTMAAATPHTAPPSSLAAWVSGVVSGNSRNSGRLSSAAAR